MGKVIASIETQETRMAVCRSCPEFTSGDFCGVCRCHMPLKVKGQMFKCPKGKW